MFTVRSTQQNYVKRNGLFVTRVAPTRRFVDYSTSTMARNVTKMQGGGGILVSDFEATQFSTAGEYFQVQIEIFWWSKHCDN